MLKKTFRPRSLGNPVRYRSLPTVFLRAALKKFNLTSCFKQSVCWHAWSMPWYYSIYKLWTIHFGLCLILWCGFERLEISWTIQAKSSWFWICLFFLLNDCQFRRAYVSYRNAETVFTHVPCRAACARCILCRIIKQKIKKNLLEAY